MISRDLVLFGAVMLSLLLGACRTYLSPVVRPDPLPGVCRNPAGEFGASGCASVRGRVVGADGQPISGTGLAGGVSAREGCSACNSPGLVIDSEGRFSETVHWFASGLPDSAHAVVHVAAIGSQYPVVGNRPAYMDSARVVLRFAPTGAPAKPTAELVLRLPIR